MVAFIFPIVWGFTGLLALTRIAGVSSTVGLGGMAFENWKLKKCVELGVDPDLLGLKLDNEDSARKMKAAELGLDMNVTTHAFKVEKVDVPHRPWLAREYLLVGTEMGNFLDGMRHLDLLDGVGPEARMLKEKLKGTNIEYEELSFLWEGFGCDFAKLQRLSDARLNDIGFRKLAGLPLV